MNAAEPLSRNLPPFHCCSCCEREDERSILATLINAAACIVAEGKENSAATEFLEAWFARKRPPLEMPAGFFK